MTCGGIYKITNTVNGKVYVGQTVRSINHRWSQHLYVNSTCTRMNAAIKKYGKENFRIDVIENVSYIGSYQHDA